MLFLFSQLWNISICVFIYCIYKINRREVVFKDETLVFEMFVDSSSFPLLAYSFLLCLMPHRNKKKKQFTFYLNPMIIKQKYNHDKLIMDFR